jgi:predicted DNA-binding protein
MGNTVTVRLPPELAQWLAETSRTTGVPASRIIREQLARAREEQEKRPFLKLAGKLNGPPDLSSRKGFARR